MTQEKLKIKLIAQHTPKHREYKYKVLIGCNKSLAEAQTHVYDSEEDAYEDAMRIQAGLLT